MAITLNDNIKINAGKPSESKYLTDGNTTYASVSAANLALSISVRYIGLTVNINNIEYWYKDGVADINLIEKKYDSEVPAGDFVTGGTSVGYFSGFTGIQTLPIDNMTDNTYDGNYNSIYNYYYRGTDQKIHVGTPSDGIPKRGYVKTTGQVKSWVWNELNNYPMGWIFVSGNIADQIGTVQPGVPYYTGVGISQPYTYTSWTSGAPVLPVQGWAAINTILGSLTTGATYTNGAPVYAGEVDQVLQFRTIMTKTPELIKITNDEALIYVSGKTPTVLGANVGTGVSVYKDTTVSGSDTTLNFRKILGGGNTVVSQSGDTIIVFSSGGTGGGSGDTYNLSSPAAITVGGIVSGTTLVGKTSFELFEELLVPTLYPTLTAPFSSISLTPSGTFEVGCNIATLCVDATYNPGAINPQYSSLSSCRSKGTTLYCFTGLGVGGPYGSTLFNYQVISPNYCVCAGANTASVHNCYCVGVQPKDSKGNNYSTPLIAGDTPDVSASITGIFPYYWGKLTSGSRPAVTNALITGGSKVLLDSNGPVTISFNSSSNEYTWFAIPATSASKHCWFISLTNSGLMNQTPVDPTNKYPDECLISIYSGQGCWMGLPVNYKAYMSKTIGAITDPIEFRNS